MPMTQKEANKQEDTILDLCVDDAIVSILEVTKNLYGEADANSGLVLVAFTLLCNVLKRVNRKDVLEILYHVLRFYNGECSVFIGKVPTNG